METRLKRKITGVSVINLVYVLVCLPFFTLAQDLNESFREANTAYANGDYNTAINTYSGLITQGYTSSELWFNLGTACLQIDSVAQANLYLERALKMDPFNNRIQKNLEIARSKVETDIYEVPEFVLKRIWDTWTNFLSPDSWMILQIVLLVIILGLVYIWQFKSTKIQGNRLRLILMVLLFVLALVFVSGSYASMQQKAQITGIIMLDNSLMSGPDSRSPVIQEVSSGVKVRIIDEIDGWLRVELLNREAGWLRNESVERI